MINYGKIIVKNIKKYNAIIKNKQKVIGNERIKVMNDIKEIIDNNKYNVDGILNVINKLNKTIEKNENEITMLEDKIIDLYSILYEDKNLDKLITQIEEFMYSIDYYEVIEKHNNKRKSKEDITLMLFTNKQDIIDYLYSINIDNMNSDDAQYREYLIAKINELFE